MLTTGNAALHHMFFVHRYHFFYGLGCTLPSDLQQMSPQTILICFVFRVLIWRAIHCTHIGECIFGRFTRTDPLPKWSKMVVFTVNFDHFFLGHLGFPRWVNHPRQLGNFTHSATRRWKKLWSRRSMIHRSSPPLIDLYLITLDWSFEPWNLHS